jgi:protein-tyrosine phosphatase
VILKSTSRLNLKNFKKYLKTTSKVSVIQEKDFQKNFEGINAIILNEKEIPIIFDKKIEREIIISSGDSKYFLKMNYADLVSFIDVKEFDLSSEEEKETFIIQYHDFKNKFQVISEFQLLEMMKGQDLFMEGKLVKKDFEKKKLLNVWVSNDEINHIYNEIKQLKTIEDEVKYKNKTKLEFDFIGELSNELNLVSKYLKHEKDSILVRKYSQVNMSSILDGFLYLGCWKDANNVRNLEALKIQRILNVTNDTLKHHSDFNVKNVSILDLKTSNIQKHFDECFQFIEESKEKNEKILVHCHAGRSRSATIVIAYLMKTQKMNLQDAIDHVKEKRKIIRPNEGFMEQLKNFEKYL